MGIQSTWGMMMPCLKSATCEMENREHVKDSEAMTTVLEMRWSAPTTHADIKYIACYARRPRANDLGQPKAT